MINMAYTKIWPVKGAASQNGMIISRVIKYDKDEKKFEIATPQAEKGSRVAEAGRC